MNRVPVQSSNIVSVGFDPAESALEVEFRPDKSGQRVIWRYAPVSPETHAAIMAAPSIGSAFAQHVRKAGIAGTRVVDEECA